MSLNTLLSVLGGFNLPSTIPKYNLKVCRDCNIMLQVPANLDKDSTFMCDNPECNYKQVIEDMTVFTPF